MSAATESYRAARDLLLGLREDPDEAHRRFEWPEVGERFNWAVDWFDAIARGNDRRALGVVEEGGTSLGRAFDEMARRSDQVAAWAGQHGGTRGGAGVGLLRDPGRGWGAP